MRGHIRKRGNRYAVVLDTGRDAATGKRRQKWHSGYATKAGRRGCARRAARQAATRRDHRPRPDAGADYLDRWLDGRTSRLAPLSVAQYRSVIRNHVHGTALGADAARQGSPRPRARPRDRARTERALGREPAHDPGGALPRLRRRTRRRPDRRRPDHPQGRSSRERRRTADAGSPSGRPTSSARCSTRRRVSVSRRCGGWLSHPVRAAASSSALTWLGFSAAARTLTIAQQVVPTRGGFDDRTVQDERVAPDDQPRRRNDGRARDAPRGPTRRTRASRRRLRRPRPDLLRRARRADQPPALTEWFGALREKAKDPARAPPRRPPLARHPSTHGWSAGAHRCRTARPQLAGRDAERLRARAADERRPGG